MDPYAGTPEEVPSENTTPTVREEEYAVSKIAFSDVQYSDIDFKEAVVYDWDTADRLLAVIRSAANSQPRFDPEVRLVVYLASGEVMKEYVRLEGAEQ